MSGGFFSSQEYATLDLDSVSMVTRAEQYTAPRSMVIGMRLLILPLEDTNDGQETLQLSCLQPLTDASDPGNIYRMW